MEEKKLPSLFVSHESPMMWDTPSPAQAFLKNLAARLPKCKAVLVVSAHWQAPEFRVSAVSKPKMIYDFGGFGEHYYEVKYPASGSPPVAQQVRELLAQQGIASAVDQNRGLDHAVWIPIGLMFPKANIPVVSLSIKFKGSPEEHFAAGQALKELRRQGVLIVGSGTATHNRRALFSGGIPAVNAEPDAGAQEFSQWLIDHANDRNAIIDYKKSAPSANHHHPTPDHFMPFIVAMGAGDGDPAECLHQSFNYSHFAMTSFSWG